MGRTPQPPCRSSLLLYGLPHPGRMPGPVYRLDLCTALLRRNLVGILRRQGDQDVFVYARAEVRATHADVPLDGVVASLCSLTPALARMAPSPAASVMSNISAPIEWLRRGVHVGAAPVAELLGGKSAPALAASR